MMSPFTHLNRMSVLRAFAAHFAINPNIPRPIPYGTIAGAYHLVGSSIVGVILVAMN